MVYFFVESFVKGTTIYINFRLELNHFSCNHKKALIIASPIILWGIFTEELPDENRIGLAIFCDPQHKFTGTGFELS